MFLVFIRRGTLLTSVHNHTSAYSTSSSLWCFYCRCYMRMHWVQIRGISRLIYNFGLLMLQSVMLYYCVLKFFLVSSSTRCSAWDHTPTYVRTRAVLRCSTCVLSIAATRSQAVARIADRIASQHLRSHVTSSVTWSFDSPYALSYISWSFGTKPLSL